MKNHILTKNIIPAVMLFVWLTTLSPVSADPQVDKLVEQLRSGDGYQRYQAAKTLQSLGPAAQPAVPALIQALGDSNWDVRYTAAEALSKIDPNWPKSQAAKDAMPDLMKIFFAYRASLYSDRSVQEAAAETLDKIDPNWRKSD